jgi:methionyl-tRNA formyltransferase
MGTPEFAVPSLRALVEEGYEVVAVCTQPDRKAGRGQRLVSSPVKQAALSLGLQVIQPESLRDPVEIQRLRDIGPEMVVVAAYGKLLPPEVLAIPRFGCLNVHPSLLPRHRGPSPVAAAILSGDAVTGVTIMLLDEGVDSGPILNQREVPILEDDTTGSLISRLANIGAQLLIETVPLWVEGKIAAKAQDESQATYSRAIDKDDGRINWQLSATELWRRVRAFEPWPGSYTWWGGKRLKVCKVVPLDVELHVEPGEVVALPAGLPVKVGVGTGKGVLGLVTVQLEGKRQMSADEFIHGHRTFIGSKLL